jgi:hypothetical protein
MFLFHRESPDLILEDEPLISEVVLTHCGGRKHVAKGETVHDSPSK